MTFDAAGALYVLNEQPGTTMERTFAPLSQGLTLYPTPASVISGNTGVFGITVQD
jgi:hypothetical protein